MILTVQYLSGRYLDSNGEKWIPTKKLCFNHAHDAAHRDEYIAAEIVPLDDFHCDECQ